LRGQAGILMDVHQGLRPVFGRLATTSFASQPQMNNLYSFDTYALLRWSRQPN